MNANMFKKDRGNMGSDEPLLVTKASSQRRARWSTTSLLTILLFSTFAQFCLYVGWSKYANAQSQECHMAEEELLPLSENLATDVQEEHTHGNLVKYQAAPTSVPLLEVFQVYQPVLTPNGVADQTIMGDGSEETSVISPFAAEASCSQVLMVHDFAFSFGLPFVGNYTPPSCDFNRVTINFTVTCSGRQFDRLAAMYFGDTEVWRTSTAEPTANGIIFTYIKDMTEFMYFWKSPQTLIFDLQNLVDDEFTGIWNTTLTATFFNSQATVDEPADLIIPISPRQGSIGQPSFFMVPTVNATNTFSIPRNANRAVFTVSACGQASEEFWWGDALQSDIDTFEEVDGTLFGFSPFREVQIFIDGQLAGVQWPFPIIFTGGVVPGFWRPIVGLDAFDLREHEIDITAWLGVLSDGKDHTFEIKVAGILDSDGSGTLVEAVLASWYVTGKIFLWLDEDEKSITTGKPPTLSLPPPVITTSQKLTQDSTGRNETLEYTTNVQRAISISGVIQSQKGGSRVESWTQSLSYSNFGLYTDFGAVQLTIQSTNGTDESKGSMPFKTTYQYPVTVNSTFIVLDSAGDFTIDGTMDRGNFITTQGSPVFPSGLQPFANIPNAAPLVDGLSGTHLATTQNGSAHFASVGGTSTGFGSTSQVFLFTGLDANGNIIDTELYTRSVAAVNSTVVMDMETLLGKEVGGFKSNAKSGDEHLFMTPSSPREVTGRGPGQAQALRSKGGS